MKALIIVDVQNDFLPNGSLEVPNSDPIIAVINKIQPYFDLVVATQDWHPKDHMSFASNHPGTRPFQTLKLGAFEQILWPDHCVQNTKGAEFPSTLLTSRIETIFRKGTDSKIDSYSAFFDNGHLKSTGLSGYLREKGAKELYFGGLAAEICVYYTIMDAVKEGFKCHLVTDATFPLDQNQYEMIKKTLLQNRVKLLSSKELS